MHPVQAEGEDGDLHITFTEFMLFLDTDEPVTRVMFVSESHACHRIAARTPGVTEKYGSGVKPILYRDTEPSMVLFTQLTG